MKITLFFILISVNIFAQVANPHQASPLGAERVSNFTVSDAGNDRLEIANGTLIGGRFIPTFWSYRDTDNTFSMVFTSSIASNFDTGNSPLMLFTTTIATQPDFNAPTTGNFVWGPSGTYLPISNRPLFEWRNSSTKLMTIAANGNVGIATNTPTARLHNNGSVRFENLGNAMTPVFMLGTDAVGNVFEYPVPTGGTGGTNDIDWLKPDNVISTNIDDVIYTNGSVGVNVQTPSSNLHIDGTVRFQNLPNSTSPVFMLGTDANGNVSEYEVPTGGDGSTNDADWLKLDNSVSFSINDAIYTNGKVGVNTNNFPSVVGDEDVSFYNLFVTGGILTEEVRVALVSDWADYVFNEDYKLPTLQEVENHIKQKGHLINIPSEEKVKESGIELGEMNKLLLEKVEELTLYLIQLNKKIEQQQKQIDKLKRKRNEE
ncbi:hypothetical protein [Flavobacterium litorale]|uniref:Peptidase S74 domain-containing protein n=1 Tax=Flavobacterium litorale TaxID=2856519 RepID=A0ABX8VBV3_9FLAO|nr:hypothetical protein [Flavobacterium litorale]QYJ68511.1 hypothetical protein K1I41_01100 [Flavobacterium litorale]